MVRSTLRPPRAAAACLVLLAASAAGAFVACGGGNGPAPPTDGGSDSTTPDATGDQTAPDAPEEPSPDAAGDSAAADAADAGTDGAADSGSDAADTGADAGGDASEAGPECAPDAGLACDGGLTCCSGQCVDPTRDPNNCGSCGTVCTTAQFCTGAACTDMVVDEVCANAHATVVLDGLAADEDAGSTIGAALAASCTPAVVVAALGQDAGGVLDPATNRPITGVGDTFVAGGGAFGQLGVAYMNNQSLTPVYVTVDGNAMTASFVQRSSKTALVTAPMSNLTAAHDYFVVQLAVEPTSGTLCFIAYGFFAPGTSAAAFWASTQMVPNRATYKDRWYVYEWTDNADGGAPGPSADDTFNLVASGM